MSAPDFELVVTFIQWLRSERYYIMRRDLESSGEENDRYDDVYETDEQLAEKFLERAAARTNK